MSCKAAYPQVSAHTCIKNVSLECLGFHICLESHVQWTLNMFPYIVFLFFPCFSAAGVLDAAGSYALLL